MIQLPPSATDEQIVAAVSDWVGLLAADRYEEACAVVKHADDDHWTPDLMRSIIRNYGFLEARKDGKTFCVTHLDERATKGNRRRPRVEWYDARRGTAYFDLPLNGEWSDLTAIMDVLKEDGGISLTLSDIHVL